ncbi:MAG: hypothetical protein ABIP20_04475 [Chthoniobacteraceae bacterium]
MKPLAAARLVLVWVLHVDASIVQVDYSYDLANGNFFGKWPRESHSRAFVLPARRALCH